MMAARMFSSILYVLDQLMPQWFFFLILMLLPLRLRLLIFHLLSLTCGNIALRLLVFVLDIFADLLLHKEE